MQNPTTMNQKTTQDGLIFYKERKGQSAIEYLMTYGWMLLVVAIVGGAIFATVSGQCLNDVTGFTGDDIEVTDYAAGENDMELVISNTAAESVEVVGISIDEGDVAEFEVDTDEADGANVAVGGESSIEMTNIDGNTNLPNDGANYVDEVTDLASPGDVDACNDYNIEVTYEREGFDITESASGNINANLQLDAAE